MEIAIFGGTFDPFHNGNLAVARQVRQQLPLARIIFVPSGNPPHKANPLDKELRYKLLCAGILGEPAFEASRLEIDRPGLSWSIDTLKELKKTCAEGSRLNFIIGEDNIRSFEQYDRSHEFFKLARLLVAPRLLPSASNLEDWRTRLPQAEILKIDCPASDISSTQVRDLLRQGKPCEHLLPPAVLKIIVELGLYKNQESATPAAA